MVWTNFIFPIYWHQDGILPHASSMELANILSELLRNPGKGTLGSLNPENFSGEHAPRNSQKLVPSTLIQEIGQFLSYMCRSTPDNSLSQVIFHCVIDQFFTSLTNSTGQTLNRKDLNFPFFNSAATSLVFLPRTTVNYQIILIFP